MLNFGYFAFAIMGLKFIERRDVRNNNCGKTLYEVVT